MVFPDGFHVALPVTIQPSFFMRSTRRPTTPLASEWPYRSIAVQTGSHTWHAGTPLDDQARARAIITAVNDAASGH